MVPARRHVSRRALLVSRVFVGQPNPSFLAERSAKCDAVAAKQKERLAKKPRVPIKIVLPDGTEKMGTSYETSPMDIAKARCPTGVPPRVLTLEGRDSRGGG